jgi:octaprenyl-diphosphate synthase
LVENQIEKQVRSFFKDHAEVEKIIKYFFDIPGKRLRPALTLLSYHLFSKNEENADQAVLLGTIVEFVHASSLIHDDIIDESDNRRGQQTLNKKFTNQIAVLAGDLIYTQALSLLIHNFEKKDIILSMLKCIERMCKGEILNLVHQELSMDDYLQVIESKTASLMAVACKVGTIISGANEEQCQCLEDYGYNFGMAYQLVDDLLDKDMQEIKNTEKVKLAEKYISKAHDSLNDISDSPYKESLLSILSFLIQRANQQEELISLTI